MAVAVVSHWIIAAPLSLLAVSMLLWPQRKKKAAPFIVQTKPRPPPLPN
jgi:hypothetical protein